MKLTPHKVCHILNDYGYEGHSNWQHRTIEVGVGDYEDEYFTDYPAIQERTLSWITAEGVAEKLLKEGLVSEPQCHCCQAMAEHQKRQEKTIIYKNNCYFLCDTIYIHNPTTMVHWCPFCGERLSE